MTVRFPTLCGGYFILQHAVKAMKWHQVLNIFALWTTTVIAHTTTNSTNSTFTHVQHAIRDGTVQVRGVNLGGWLVAEHWMTQGLDIWQGVADSVASGGEQQAIRNGSVSKDQAHVRFQQHHATFITEDAIRAIAAAGLNTVRVPIGYWIVGFDHQDVSNQSEWQWYASDGLRYLDQLIREWAVTHNVAVLLSMHAAKGSQNGQDHSSPAVPGQSFWSQYPENVLSTLDAVSFLAARYKDDQAFLGIGLLNEPGGSTDRSVLYQYYHDAIAPLLWEQSPQFMTDVLPTATNVWVEWHRYFVWGFETSDENQLITSAMDEFERDAREWQQKSNKRLFIGEFSFATAKEFSSVDKLKEFIQRQMGILKHHVDGGWTFWSWRIQGDDKSSDLNRWSLQSVLQHQLFW